MRTLVVNCYLERAEEKIAGYVAQAERFGESCVVAWRELNRAFALDPYAAVVISGSQWLLSKHEPPQSLLEFTRGLNLPTLGICFGHQLLARAFGGRVLSGELIKRHETVELAQTSPLFYDLGPKADFVESHREYVDPDSILPAGWQVSARSGSCPVEAMSHPTRPLLGVQFHPERSGANGEKLLDNFYRRIVASFTRSRAPEAAIP